jgi:hypothetical protein
VTGSGIAPGVLQTLLPITREGRPGISGGLRASGSPAGEIDIRFRSALAPA